MEAARLTGRIKKLNPKFDTIEEHPISDRVESAVIFPVTQRDAHEL